MKIIKWSKEESSTYREQLIFKSILRYPKIDDVDLRAEFRTEARSRVLAHNKEFEVLMIGYNSIAN